jgi:ABC-type dipeptide/oligopeptide/nickel transport system permease subunit
MLLLLSVTGLWWLPGDPLTVDLGHALQHPNREHLFGTDQLGRDLLSRLILGARTSLLTCAAVTAVGATCGVSLGILAGFLGGVTDLLVMRAVDLLMAFPGILLALLFVSILGPGVGTTVVAVAIIQIPRFARVTRGRVLEVRHREYVDAGRAIGARELRLATRYVLPDCYPVIVVLATLAMGQAVLFTAGLGFLGLGVQPPTPEWGTMLADARKYVWSAPHEVVFPGMAIFGAIIGFNLLGDGLRDAMDVRLT